MATWMKDHLKYDSIAWDDVNEGDEIPSTVRPIGATLVVMGAVAASRDVYPVHHDVEAAKAAGAPDIFLNILTTNGLMAAFVTNWCGPDWDLRSISLKLLIPAFPGQKLTTTGTVTRKYDDPVPSIEVEFTAETDFGPHCKGSATLTRA